MSVSVSAALQSHNISSILFQSVSVSSIIQIRSSWVQAGQVFTQPAETLLVKEKKKNEFVEFIFFLICSF